MHSTPSTYRQIVSRCSRQPGRRSAAGVPLLLALALLALATLPLGRALAHPFDHVVVDGVIQADETDWYPDDLVVNDQADDNLSRTSNVRRLWLTWDADSLYVGITYQDFGTAEGLRIYIDLGRGVGPTSCAVLDTFAANFQLPQGHHCDLVIGRPLAEAFSTSDNEPPQVHRVTNGGGATEDITILAHIAQGFDQGKAPAAARFPFWYNAEIGIAWSTLYPGLATTVPPRCVLKLVAVIASGGAQSNGWDSAPNNPGLDGGTTPVLLSSLSPSILDFNGDGEPDPLDASISGTIDLPGNPSGTAVTGTAYLLNWSGRPLDAPVSRFTSQAGQHDFTIGRLPPGDYRVEASAPGYMSASTTVTVSAGGQVTGLEFSLTPLTSVSGTVSFPPGYPGVDGTLRLRDATGNVVDSLNLPRSGLSFTLYFLESGEYTLVADVPENSNYLDTALPLSLTAGVDVSGVALQVTRKTIVGGTVTWTTPPPAGTAGKVRLFDGLGNLVKENDFTSITPGFTFFVGAGGTYQLQVEMPHYVPTDTLVDVTLGQDLTDLTIFQPRMAELIGSASFEGPAADGIAVALPPGGAPVDTAAFTAQDPSFRFFLLDGTYTIRIDALGYDLRDTTVSVVRETIYQPDPVFLTAVRGTRLVLVNTQGQEVPSVATTVSKPDEDKYFFAALRLAARDASGRPDLYDLDARLRDYTLRLRKLDDVSLPRGNARVTANEDVNDPLTSLDFAGGGALAYVSDDAVEVLRIFVENVNPGVPTGRFMVGIREPQATTVVLTADRESFVANGVDEVTVTAQLYDSTEQPSPTEGVPVSFSVAPSSSGAGLFQVATVETNADGLAQAVLTATGSGTILVDAAAVVDNVVLEVRAGSVEGSDELLALTALPGPTAAVALSLPGRLAGLVDPVPVLAQLVDAFGNPTPLAGVAISFAASPAGRGSFVPGTGLSQDDGGLSVPFQPSGQAGAVTLTASAPPYAAGSADLQLRDLLVVTDPPWYAELRTRQTFAATDLTSVLVDNDAGFLRLDIPFASNWTGLQLSVILETNFDAAGGTQDAFQMPVSFGQADRPDYSLIFKYSSNDYADFRRWNPSKSGWEYWNRETQQYSTNVADANDIHALWVNKQSDLVTMAIPWAPFGGPPDSLRLEVYLTQDDNGVKRSAFDSCPSDSTLNLSFPPDSTDPADWATTTQNHTLVAWSRVYRIKQLFPTPPQVSEAAADPRQLQAGTPFTLSARVIDAGDGVGDVLADLSAMAGSPLARMYDDGDPGHGDLFPDDDTYSLMATVPLASPGGNLNLIVSAYDATNALAARDSAAVNVAASIEVLVHAEDPEGDDHGPNQPGEERKFYVYPTNSAFVPGAFDLTSLDVYETVAVVAGSPIDVIAFAVGIRDFPDPNAPGTADWNPPYAELNVEKIDIMIDSGPGGATRGLPYRQAGFQRWDAWDYAIVMDGWYKGVIPSLGQNTVESWRRNVLRSDRDILLLGDPVTDRVTALVSREALGNPTAEDIRGWDICVVMASHDIGDDENDFGGIRWVDQVRSEWRFGGGNNNDWDANVTDLLLIPGAGHAPGRSQEFLLDYESPEAIDRLDRGETPVAIEMSAFEDTGPPVVRILRNAGEVVRRSPLRGAPIAFALEIFDDYRVDEVQFRYRSSGTGGSGWDVETPMGYLGNDLWVVDLMPSWLDANLVYSPLDSTRYLEFEVTARDPLNKETTTPVTTMQIDPATTCSDTTSSMAAGELSLRQVEGSALLLDDALRRALVAGYQKETGSADPVDSLAAHLDLLWDLCVPPVEVRDAPAVPAGQPLGVFREFYLDGVPAEAGPTLNFEGMLPGQLDLTLHYPQAWIPSGQDENKIGLYEYQERSHRWVLVGGHVNPVGNSVTARVNHMGAYGLFLSQDVDYDPNQVISGILISPNPFSPNGDGLYDECTISFYLNQEATVTAEIYNIEGRPRRTLTDTFPFSGEDNAGRVPRRVPGLIWDGRDHSGKLLPYGIYVVRLVVTYNQAGGTRSVRSNHAVVLIR